MNRKSVADVCQDLCKPTNVLTRTGQFWILVYLHTMEGKQARQCAQHFINREACFTYIRVCETNLLHYYYYSLQNTLYKVKCKAKKYLLI